MTTFDFITTAEFRASLEADYAELNICRANAAWKSSLVLAGSIIEALLIDYLIQSPAKILGDRDPLRLDLAEAISLSKEHKIISQRAADLCSVIRSYRNLLHPGRQIRLQEAPPSQQTADIAIALVDVIVEEIANARKGAFGFTAEQVVSKLFNDHNSLALLPFLIKEVHETELDRLIMTAIPKKVEEAVPDMFDNYEEERNRLVKGYKIIFESAPIQIKEKAVNRFLQILKSASGVEVDSFADNFFSPSYLEYLKEKDRPIVKEYYHEHQPKLHSSLSASKYSEFAQYLQKKDLSEWLDPFIRAIYSTSNSSEERAIIRNELIRVQSKLPESIAEAHDNRIKDWIAFYSDKKDHDKVESLTKLKEESQSSRELPF